MSMDCARRPQIDDSRIGVQDFEDVSLRQKEVRFDVDGASAYQFSTPVTSVHTICTIPEACVGYFAALGFEKRQSLVSRGCVAPLQSRLSRVLHRQMPDFESAVTNLNLKY